MTRYFLGLGALGFGGPIALTGRMRRDLVDEREWISDEEFAEGLALAQLAPGPLAAQVAIYLGWVRGGNAGATLAGIAFVLPSFIIVVLLAAAYTRFGGLNWLQGAFYGVGAAVIAIICRGLVKLTKSTLHRDYALWGIFAVCGLVTAVQEREPIILILASGAFMMAYRARMQLQTRSVLIPGFLISGLHGPASAETLTDLWWYFIKAGAFVFGSGLAIVPFLYGGVVEEFRWLTERQFLDAVAVAMVTPGPVVITVAFIGYLVGGPSGATLAAFAVFLPCYLFVILPAPYFRKIAQQRSIHAFIAGVTAAAVGAIAGAAIVLGRRAIYDIPTVLIFAAILFVLFRWKQVPEPLLVFVAGIAGYLLGKPV